MQLCSSPGIVHINVPNARSFHRLLAVEMGLISDVFALSDTQRTMQQSRTYDLDSLKSYLEGFGLKIVDAGSYFVKPFTHAQMHCILEKGCIGRDVIEALFGMSKYMPDLGSEIYVNASPTA